MCLCYFYNMNKNLFELSYTVRKDFEKKVTFVSFYVICIFIVLNLLLTFVVFPVRTESLSMAPDSSEGTCVLCSPLKRSLSRGDVVLVASPFVQSASIPVRVADVFVRFFTAQQFSVITGRKNMGANPCLRRIVGLPGDTLYMRDYVMYVKPSGSDYFLTEFELVKKPYNVSIMAAPALWDSSMGVCGSFDEVTLSDGEYFVLGDYRNSSVDSRLTGYVSEKNIKAAAFATYFPLSRFKLYF